MLKAFKILVLLAGAACATASAHAQKAYDPGASDTEIRIGNIAPYSGPASAYGVMAKAQAAYFAMVNDQGGINGRKIRFISYDDAYSPPKTVEQARKLVEGDEVFLLFGTIGTAPNVAIQKYMNTRKVPQVFIGSGSSRFSDPKNFPYTMGWGTTYRAEAIIYARYLLANKPAAKIGILYQNDDLGKELVNGFKEGLGDKSGSMIVAEVPYETSSPTIDSEVVRLKSSGADVLFSAATPKFVAQEIRKVSELDWKPLHIVAITGSYIAASIKPVGFDKAQGIISSNYWKDPTDSQWANDPAMGEWRAWMAKYHPDGDKNDNLNVAGYVTAQNLVAVLKQAGDNLTRENVMKLLRSMKDLEFGLLLPGIKVNTGPNDPTPISQTQMMRIKGEQWELFGPIISSSDTIKR